MSLKIGVLDSGIGGLSVLNALYMHLSECNYIYVADQAYLPYGIQPPELIIERIFKICDFLSNSCDIIVIACNTATALAIDMIRPHFSLPIIGIEPAIKPACLATQTGHIAICATQNMLESPRLNNLIARYGEQKTLYKIPCASWVTFVEAGLSDLKPQQTDAILQDIQRKFKDILNKIDQIILGCTHFPFLVPYIQQVIPAHIHLIDPAHAIALRVESFLNDKAILATKKDYLNSQQNKSFIPSTTIECYSSSDPLYLAQQVSQLNVSFYDHCSFKLFNV